MYEHVVVGVNDSESTPAAVDRAVELAKISGGTVHLVSAFGLKRSEPSPPMPEEFRYTTASVDPVDWRLSQMEKVARKQGVPVTTHAVLGEPVEALTRVAKREAADLIVVGAAPSHAAHHRATVADTLMRWTSCAVLTV
jgi:nucleotide-binding universal stress UspA family protein